MTAGHFTASGERIVTSYWAKPIPDRRFDWCAYVDGTEESGPSGYGRTEPEAIADLREQLDEDAATPA